MDRLFFNVGLSASLLLSTHPRFASHPETICWICLSGQWAEASFVLFPGRLHLLPAWPGEHRHGQTFTVQAAASARGPSAPSLELCWQKGLYESSLRSPGLTKMDNKGCLRQPKFVWRTHMMPFISRAVWTEDFHWEARMKNAQPGLPARSGDLVQLNELIQWGLEEDDFCGDQQPNSAY